eukprot:4785534-Pleurochrysis_carterae.AAC.3
MAHSMRIIRKNNEIDWKIRHNEWSWGGHGAPDLTNSSNLEGSDRRDGADVCPGHSCYDILQYL